MAQRATIDPTTGFGTAPTPTAAAPPRRVAPVASLAGAPASATTQRVPPTARPIDPSTIVAGGVNRQQAVNVGGMTLNLDIPEGPLSTTAPPAPAAAAAETYIPDTSDYYNTGVNGGASYSVHPVPLDGGHAGGAAGTPPPIPADRRDAAAIGQWVAYYATLPGADPSLRTSPDYWIGRILEKGGLGADNTNYWQWMALNNYKQPLPSGGASGTGGTGPIRNTELDSLLAQFLSDGGLSAYGTQMQGLLSGLMASGGLDAPQTQQRLIGAREDAANAFTGQLADVRNALASQGQLGSGFGDDAVARLGERIAPTYASAVRDIQTNAMDTANQNIMSAFALATGLAQSEASNLLQALGTGMDRDVAFAQIALQQLSENRQWNQFLAQYGLDREQLAYQIQHGDTAQLIELLRLWMSGAQTAADGQAA